MSTQNYTINNINIGEIVQIIHFCRIINNFVLCIQLAVAKLHKHIEEEHQCSK